MKSDLRYIDPDAVLGKPRSWKRWRQVMSAVEFVIDAHVEVVLYDEGTGWYMDKWIWMLLEGKVDDRARGAGARIACSDFFGYPCFEFI